jgi:lauroyl/myristoyl acyltransferase
MSRSRKIDQDQPSERREQLISFSDIVVTLIIPPLMFVAWIVPGFARPRLARMLASAVVAFKRNRAAEEAPRLAAPFDCPDADGFYLDVLMHGQLERLNLFAQYSPFPDLPGTRVRGAEHVSMARAAGRGVLLWVMPTAHSRTESKLSLHNAGIRAHHLSRVTHGFSPTRYGKAVLNPLRTRLEARYLAGRIVIGEGGARKALAALSRHLSNGEVVTITMGDQASRVRSTPFITGLLTIATRPIFLARETGAVLLPVVSIRNDSGIIETDIGMPLMRPDDPAEAVDRLVVERLVQFLEPHVRAHPEQYARAYVFKPLEARA